MGFGLPFRAPVSPVAGALVESGGVTAGAAGAGAAAESFFSAFSDSAPLLQAVMITPANRIPKTISVSFVLFCLIILVVLRHKVTIFFPTFK